MSTKPADFDAYWQQTRDDLANYPMAPELEVLPLRSTDFATLYGVRLTSIGPYRLYGYLSIPQGEGPFPAIFYTPRYQSVLEIIPQGTANLQRSAYITFMMGARGQRNSDAPYAASFPGLLTDGIQSAQTYIFRGVVADAVRGLEFLRARPELDPSRLVVYGNDLALITAALGQGATHVVTTPTLFYNTAELAQRSARYPLEELNDYGRMFPQHQTSVRQTLAYYDLRAFGPQVTANTLIMAGAPGSLLERQVLAPLVEAVAGETTVHDSEQSSYRDGLYAETWMAQQCGIGDVNRILPPHWRG